MWTSQRHPIFSEFFFILTECQTSITPWLSFLSLCLSPELIDTYCPIVYNQNTLKIVISVTLVLQIFICIKFQFLKKKPGAKWLTVCATGTYGSNSTKRGSEHPLEASRKWIFKVAKRASVHQFILWLEPDTTLLSTKKNEVLRKCPFFKVVFRYLFWIQSVSFHNMSRII